MLEMLIDKDRKYWIFFIEFNLVDFLFLNNILNNFLKLFIKKDLLILIIYGGNIVVLKYIKLDNNIIFNLIYYIDIVLCFFFELV